MAPEPKSSKGSSYPSNVLSTLYAFSFFFLPIVLARLSSIMLNRSVEKDTLTLFPTLGGKYSALTQLFILKNFKHTEKFKRYTCAHSIQVQQLLITHPHCFLSPLRYLCSPPKAYENNLHITKYLIHTSNIRAFPAMTKISHLRKSRTIPQCHLIFSPYPNDLHCSQRHVQSSFMCYIWILCLSPFKSRTVRPSKCMFSFTARSCLQMS